MQTRENSRRIFSALLASFCLAPPLTAQSGDSGGQRRFRRVSEQLELPSQTITFFHQDRQHLVWIGTYAGLCRFDGDELLVFNNESPNPTHGLVHSVHGIVEDEREALWFATWKDGVAKLTPDSFDFVNYTFGATGKSDDEVARRLVHSIERGPENDIYAGTAAGLIVFDSLEPELYSIHHAELPNGAPMGPIHSLEYDPDTKTMWVAAQGGLCAFDTAAKEFVDTAIGGITEPYTVCKSRFGPIWCGTPGGMFRLDPMTRTSRRAGGPLGTTNVREVFQAATGDLWVGTLSQGVFAFNSLTEQVLSSDRYDAADALSVNGDRIEALYQSQDGVLWIGTYFDGFATTDPSQFSFSTLRSTNGLAGDTIRSVLETRSGELWVGTTNGLSIVNGEQTRAVHRRTETASGLTHNDVRCLGQDSSDRIWIGTREGLDVWDSHTAAVHPAVGHISGLDPSLASEHLRYLFEDREHRLWVCVSDGPIRCYELEKNRMHADVGPRGLLIKDGRHVMQDSRGDIYVSTAGFGVYRVRTDASGVLTAKNIRFLADEPDSDNVKCVVEDGTGKYWAASNFGICSFDASGKETVRHTVETGLPNNTVYGILVDDDQKLWVSTNLGIASVDPSTGAIRKFTKLDGLQGDEYNSNAFGKRANGTLCFGGTRGLNCFDPSAVSWNRTRPTVVLTGLRVNYAVVFPSSDGTLTRRIEHTEKLVLNASQKVVEFRYATAHFTDPRGNAVEYRLRPYDPGWVAADGSGIAKYTSLPHGSYTLEFRVRSATEVNGEEAVALDVTVLPPWYLTWMAILLYLAAGVAALHYLIVVRTQRIRRRAQLLEDEVRRRTAELAEANALKENMFTMVAHDLRVPIDQVLHLSEIAPTGPQGAKARSTFTRIHGLGEILKDMADTILDLHQYERARIPLEVQRVGLANLVGSVFERFEHAVAEKDLRLDNEIGTGVVVAADPGVLLRVLQNLVDNAVKYSPNSSTVRVTASVENDRVIARVINAGHVVTDTGDRTRDESTADSRARGLGLDFCKKAIEEHGGRLTLEQDAKSGTSVTFELSATGGDPAPEPPPAPTATSDAILDTLPNRPELRDVCRALQALPLYKYSAITKAVEAVDDHADDDVAKWKRAVIESVRYQLPARFKSLVGE